jgi:hypothetical protein
MLSLVINKNLKGINLKQELLKLKMLGSLKIIKFVGEKYHTIWKLKKLGYKLICPPRLLKFLFLKLLNNLIIINKNK